MKLSRDQIFPALGRFWRYPAPELTGRTTNPPQPTRMASLGLAFLIGVSTPGSALAASGLSAKEARGLIVKSIGLESGAVKVSQVSVIDSNNAEATTQITTAFRLERQDKSSWQVAEVRTGQDRWEAIELIGLALKAEVEAEMPPCENKEPIRRSVDGTEPTARIARCVIARLLGIAPPLSDAVRIKDISASLPFSSTPSALVEAMITVDFRFSRPPKSSWQVVGIRTGRRGWVEPVALLKAVNDEKTARTRLDMRAIVSALEEFRAQRGYYVEADSEAVLIDFLSPEYLSRIIRLDPWQRPYTYEGSRDRFTLRSSGPDRTQNTPDDIVLTGSAPSATR